VLTASAVIDVLSVTVLRLPVIASSSGGEAGEEIRKLGHSRELSRSGALSIDHRNDRIS
jgi:hypothetical protein